MSRVIVVLAVALLLAVVPMPPQVPTPPSAAAAAPRADVLRALQVLHAWDVRRARAWAASDTMALRALYLPGSGAARADLRLMRAYTARGLVVRRLVTQVYGVIVLRQERRRMVLRVWDRVAGGVVVHRGRERPLSSSRPVVRTVELVLQQGRWRVATIGP